MTLSEIIEKLHELEKQYGNVNVCCDYLPLSIDNVRYDDYNKVVNISAQEACKRFKHFKRNIKMKRCSY